MESKIVLVFSFCLTFDHFCKITLKFFCDRLVHNREKREHLYPSQSILNTCPLRRHKQINSSIIRHHLEIIMSTSDANLPSDIFSMKANEFYDYVESTFSFEIKELIRIQGFTSASSILYSREHLLALLDIDSNDLNLLAVKQMIAFHQNDGTWKVKAGVQYDVDCFLSALNRCRNREKSDQCDGSMFIPADVLRRFPWLKPLLAFCQSDLSSPGLKDLTFLFAFIENISNNLVTSPNRYRYSDEVEEFSFVLFLLAGRQGYEFIRLNLPGSLPSLSTLSSRFDQNREKLLEGQFRFDSMQTHFSSASVKYVFASEDCTGVIQKISYDRNSNSFIGFCPPLKTDGFPRISTFNIDSFNELEHALRTQKTASLLNIHVLQPITSGEKHLSPFLLSAYGTDNEFDSYDMMNRWLKMFEETSQRGIRIVGFSTDCDPRYLRTMRLITNFFSSLPNFNLRNRPDTFKITLPSNWHWFFLDTVQLFVVFQV